MEEIRYLAQNTTAQVVICALPVSLYDAMESEEISDDQEDVPDPAEAPRLDFHDMLKAGAMLQYRKPIQIILPWTYGLAKQRSQTRTKSARELQDEATRAWNIHSALYYKAGEI